MVSEADGSGARFLAPMEGTNHPLPSAGESVSWAPDGRRIAYVSATPGPEHADANGDPMVITRYLYKPTAGEGTTRFNDNRRTHVFVVDVGTRQVSQLTEGDAYEHSIDWAPAGDEVAFVSNREADPDKTFNYDVFTCLGAHPAGAPDHHHQERGVRRRCGRRTARAWRSPAPAAISPRRRRRWRTPTSG